MPTINIQGFGTLGDEVPLPSSAKTPAWLTLTSVIYGQLGCRPRHYV